MKTISLSVSEEDYEAFRDAARSEGRPIAALIREAMAVYRAERLGERTPLEQLPVITARRVLSALPSRSAVHDEIFGGRESVTDTVNE